MVGKEHKRLRMTPGPDVPAYEEDAAAGTGGTDALQRRSGSALNFIHQTIRADENSGDGGFQFANPGTIPHNALPDRQ